MLDKVKRTSVYEPQRVAINHTQNHKTSIQRGKKLDQQGISQNFMLSQQCSLLLLGPIISILSTLISNLLVLFSNPPPPYWYCIQALKET